MTMRVDPEEFAKCYRMSITALDETARGNNYKKYSIKKIYINFTLNISYKFISMVEDV